MIIELGHYALVLALATCLVVSILPVIGARRGDAAMMAVATTGTYALFLLVAFSFAVLTYGYVVSDFSVQNVYQNSHSLKPMIYKVSGVWGNHEGSMLLWVLILAFFSAMVAFFGTNLPDRLKANVLAVQAWITTAFTLFILLTSNPSSGFRRSRRRARILIRSCRTSVSRSIRRCFILAMSVSRSASRLRLLP